MYNGQYLIAANSKKGQLIFNIFRKVDFPQPDGPIKAVTCFSGISIFIFFKA